MTRRSRRVDRWVDDLLSERSPRGLRGADREDRAALAAAIELRSAASGSAVPDPRFVEQLHRRIAQETQGEALPQPRVSRRTLLRSGGAVAAAAAAGVVVGDRLTQPAAPVDRTLIADGANWVDIAALSEVPLGTARRFSTASFEGFVVNRDGTTVEALSASCTHLGCILRFNAATKRLDCPCHNAAFGLDGNLLHNRLYQDLPPLPRLPTRVRNGRVEVLTV